MIWPRVATAAVVGAAVLVGCGAGGSVSPRRSAPNGSETVTLVASWEKVPDEDASARWTPVRDTTGQDHQARLGCPETRLAGRLCRTIAPALVNLYAVTPTGIRAGTGIVLSTDGLVLTNYHVIVGAGDQIAAEAGPTGQKWRAQVVGEDPDQDVALIRLVDASGLHPATMDWCGQIRVGQAVAVAGNAWGNAGYPQVSLGTVTAVRASTPVTDEWKHTRLRENMILIRAEVEPGESGGALITRDGRVIGLITSADQRYLSGVVLPLSGVKRALSRSAGITVDTRGRLRQETIWAPHRHHCGGSTSRGEA